MDELFTATEAAAILKISRRAFDRLDLPRHYITGSKRSPRWTRHALELHLTATLSVPPTLTPMPRRSARRTVVKRHSTLKEQLALERMTTSR